MAIARTGLKQTAGTRYPKELIITQLPSRGKR